jgi:hypothetical protein
MDVSFHRKLTEQAHTPTHKQTPRRWMHALLLVYVGCRSEALKFLLCLATWCPVVQRGSKWILVCFTGFTNSSLGRHRTAIMVKQSGVVGGGGCNMKVL